MQTSDHRRNVRSGSIRLALVLPLLLGVLSLGGPGVPGAPRPAFAQATAPGDTTLPDSAVVASPEDADDWGDLEGKTRDIVRMGESIEIEAGQTVRGDVVAIGGSVEVHGRVLGDVVAVGGCVCLHPGSYVRGDAVAVGGKVEVDPGAELRGDQVSLGDMSLGGLGRLLGRSEKDRKDSIASRTFSIWWDVLRFIGFFLVGMILFLAFPQRMENMRKTASNRFWLCLVVGIGLCLVLPAVLILLGITCIGLLVVVPVVFLLLLVAAGSGAAVFANIGRAVLRRPLVDRRSWIECFAMGLGLLLALQLIGRLFGMAGGGVSFMGGAIRGIVTAVWIVVLLTGLGSFLMSKLGAIVSEKPGRLLDAAPEPPLEIGP